MTNLADALAITRHRYARIRKDSRWGKLLISSVSLAFDMEPQVRSNWCWAATATSVSHFYLATSGDLHLAISEDFPMAMDRAAWCAATGPRGRDQSSGAITPNQVRGS